MVVVLDFFLLLDFTLKHLKKTLDFTAKSVLPKKSVFKTKKRAFCVWTLAMRCGQECLAGVNKNPSGKCYFMV